MKSNNRNKQFQEHVVTEKKKIESKDATSERTGILEADVNCQEEEEEEAGPL